MRQIHPMHTGSASATIPTTQYYQKWLRIRFEKYLED